MTFTYAPSNTFNPQQPVPTKAAIILNNGLDDDNTAYIVVSGNIFFQGQVATGDSFTASIANAGRNFASNTYIYFYDAQGGQLLQQVAYHTPRTTRTVFRITTSYLANTTGGSP